MSYEFQSLAIDAEAELQEVERKLIMYLFNF